jgi:catechol 2,3-dioxygenase-like lactoylglutathione lyase family enzyme
MKNAANRVLPTRRCAGRNWGTRAASATPSALTFGRVRSKMDQTATGTAMPETIHPKKFAHVVYRTRRFAEMLQWYQTVFGATIQHQNPALAFLTYDDEHHRVALLNLDLVQPGGEPGGVPRRHPGVDHVAYTYASLRDLLETYDRLQLLGVRPYWCIHHGITVSMYYADPDGNQMEFQVDSFTSNEAANAFMEGPHFGANPIGVEYDPDAMLARLRAGEPEQAMLPRTVHQPVSELRGSIVG